MGYIYNADVYCDDCGDVICERIKAEGNAPEDFMDQSSYDSDDYPKSTDIENEESDIPHCCSKCGEFLHNPLTSDGYKYVQSALNEISAGTSIGKLLAAGHPHLVEWASWYNFRYWDTEDCADESNGRKVGWYSDEAF